MAAKKKSLHATGRDTLPVRVLRSAFVEALHGKDVTCIKFVDETSNNLTYYRCYARAVGGQAPARRAERDTGGVPDPGLQAAMTTNLTL